MAAGTTVEHGLLGGQVALNLKVMQLLLQSSKGLAMGQSRRLHDRVTVQRTPFARAGGVASTRRGSKPTLHSAKAFEDAIKRSKTSVSSPHRWRRTRTACGVVGGVVRMAATSFLTRPITRFGAFRPRHALHTGAVIIGQSRAAVHHRDRALSGAPQVRLRQDGGPRGGLARPRPHHGQGPIGERCVKEP